MNEAHYAVVVGINRYPGVSDLAFAKRDAEAFRDWLVDPDGGGLPKGNVELVTVASDEEAGFTAAVDSRPALSQVNAALIAVNRAVRAQVEDDPQAWEATRLYLYASGHGIAPGDGAAAVLMADADSDPMVQSFGNSVELGKYTQWYVGCGLFREFVVFADCCRDRNYAAPGTGPPMASCQQPYGATNPALGFATTYGESAFEPTDVTRPDDGRGYFTRALLDGLTGGAQDLTGRIDTLSLAAYVAASVKAQTSDRPFTQRPTMPIDAANPIVFRMPGGQLPRHRRTVTVHFPADWAGPVELRSGSGFQSTGRSWDATRGPWRLEVEEGLWAVHAEQPPAGGFASGGAFSVIARDADVQL